MSDKIFEIYTDDTGAFTVGQIEAENEDDLVIRGIDEEGKVSAYYVVPKKNIREMVSDTPYLGKIRRYMKYAEEHSYGEWFKLPPLPADPSKPLLSQVLHLAKENGMLITIGKSGDEELLCGYVREIEKGRILLDLVDPESAQDLTQVKIRIRDLEFIEYASISNMLLMYANKY